MNERIGEGKLEIFDDTQGYKVAGICIAMAFGGFVERLRREREKDWDGENFGVGIL